MSIFLSILKVLGIILGILLAVILALVLLILFLPICYGIETDIREKQAVKIRGRASWMFSVIQVKLSGEGKNIRIWLSIAGWKKTLHPKPKTVEEAEEMVLDSEEEDLPEETENIETSIQTAEIHSGEKQWEQEDPGEEQPVHRDESEKEVSDQKKRKSLQKYLPWNMMRAWTAKIKRKFADIKEKFENIKKELSDENNRDAVSHILQELKKILRHVGPRRGKADLRYSMGDPALTGQLTGILSMIPLFYKKGVDVIPDFASEKFYIRGSARVNGHIQVFPLLCSAFRMYRDKNIRNLIQKFK